MSKEFNVDEYLEFVINKKTKTWIADYYGVTRVTLNRWIYKLENPKLAESEAIKKISQNIISAPIFQEVVANKVENDINKESNISEEVKEVYNSLLKKVNKIEDDKTIAYLFVELSKIITK